MWSRILVVLYEIISLRMTPVFGCRFLRKLGTVMYVVVPICTVLCASGSFQDRLYDKGSFKMKHSADLSQRRP